MTDGKGGGQTVKTQYVFAMVILARIILATGAVEAEEITGGDVRVVLDGKYALTSEGYAEYRKCIAAIEFGGTMKAYKDAVEDCKKKAKETAFTITPSSSLPSTAITPPSSPGITGKSKEMMIKDREWQQQIYTK